MSGYNYNPYHFTPAHASAGLRSHVTSATTTRRRMRVAHNPGTGDGQGFRGTPRQLSQISIRIRPQGLFGSLQGGRPLSRRGRAIARFGRFARRRRTP